MARHTDRPPTLKNPARKYKSVYQEGEYFSPVSDRILKSDIPGKLLCIYVYAALEFYCSMAEEHICFAGNERIAAHIKQFYNQETSKERVKRAIDSLVDYEVVFSDTKERSRSRKVWINPALVRWVRL